jgi:DNA-binding TFAR19-related protein (PDSD5 family)
MWRARWTDAAAASLCCCLLVCRTRGLVSRIAIVKPDKARAIEDMVIQMAQRGQLAAKIDEDKLIDLLNQVGVTEEKQRTKVTVRAVEPAGCCERRIAR